MKKIFNCIIIIGLLFAGGCKKEPGVGGNASISGQVITRKFNATFTGILGTYPSADHYVYIVYGDNVGYDGRTKTDNNGYYKFQYLYPGKYKIYTYSKDSTGQILSGTVAVTNEVVLKRNGHSEMPNFIIYE
ncbi:MAG: hypothetical protein EBR94_04875 [Bacteroidetes bacterium]|jgi:hypothetical protein|nr:hypothetical protein [Bacteroidota bacterium]